MGNGRKKTQIYSELESASTDVQSTNGRGKGKTIIVKLEGVLAPYQGNQRSETHDEFRNQDGETEFLKSLLFGEET